MIFQTFNGYAMSQFKKIEQDIRTQGEVRWKHAMHLLRLLLTGAQTLREGRVPVRVEAHRDRLLSIKRGEVPWPEVDVHGARSCIAISKPLWPSPNCRNARITRPRTAFLLKDAGKWPYYES